MQSSQLPTLLPACLLRQIQALEEAATKLSCRVRKARCLRKEVETATAEAESWNKGVREAFDCVGTSRQPLFLASGRRSGGYSAEQAGDSRSTQSKARPADEEQAQPSVGPLSSRARRRISGNCNAQRNGIGTSCSWQRKY